MHPEFGPEIGIRQGELIADKYRVDRILGVGGMGVVLAAHHLRLDELVAIKVLLPEAVGDADAVRRFEREARAAVKIKSEHVTRIIDVGTLEDGTPFIVMEYLDGEDLAERIVRTGPLAIEDAIELLLQACEAIAEAHAIGVVHRDLKPANLFCVRGADGRISIKVLDFGISKLTHAAAAGSGFGMTKTRAVMGSPYYMSPEQMESPRTVDARTDIWSLGIVLYQLLTGEVPFSGETLPQVCVNVATRPAPPLRKFRPDVPNGLEAVALRCLEKDPNKRYPTVAALATAMARFGPRRAQTSLDRITRTSGHAEARLREDVGPAYARATERPVTGPLPSWGGTAKSPQGARGGAIRWLAAAFVIASAGFTFAFLQASTRFPWKQAVLITPPGATSPSEIPAESPSAEPLAAPSLAGGGPVVETAAPPNPPLAASSSLPTTSEAAAPDPGAPPVPRSPSPATALPSRAVTPADLPRPSSPAVPAVGDTPANPYEAPPGASAATCVLNLNSLPAATVVLDGKPLGYTPRMGIVVTAGEHHIVFHWENNNRRTSVTCSKGQTRTVAVRLDDPAPVEDIPERNPYR